VCITAIVCGCFFVTINCYNFVLVVLLLCLLFVNPNPPGVF